MKMYIELSIDDGPGAVISALRELSLAIKQRQLDHDDELERSAISSGAYANVSETILDIDVR